jgi:hypothetical protein
MLQNLVTSNAAQQYGRYRPERISPKPVLKEAKQKTDEWWTYWIRTHIMDKGGWCEEAHYGEAMQDLKLHVLSEEQFKNLQRDMILQEDHPTSRDKQVPFKFHIDWLREWIISTCVDMDEF